METTTANRAAIFIGAGPGLGITAAELFGQHGYQIGLINRQPKNASVLVEQLAAKGIVACSQPADASQPAELEQAIGSLRAKLGPISALVYNAAAIREKDILAETAETLTRDFQVNVAGALQSVQLLLQDLKATRGVVLLTGGGFANYPHPAYGSLSIGKAGLRNLALQLHQRLKDEGIYAGTLTVGG